MKLPPNLNNIEDFLPAVIYVGADIQDPPDILRGKKKWKSELKMNLSNLARH